MIDDNKYIEEDDNGNDDLMSNLNTKSIKQLLGLERQEQTDKAKLQQKQKDKTKTVQIKFVKPADVHSKHHDILQIKS